MPSSLSQDVCHALFMHKVPDSMSTDDFERKLEALIDEIVILPVVQENLVKLEMILQNNKVDDGCAAFGLPPREHAVFVMAQSKVLAASEVRNVYDQGKEFGLHGSSFGSAASLSIYIDSPMPKNGVHLFCVYNVPFELAINEAHGRSWDVLIDNFVQLPVVQENFSKFEIWHYNDTFDDSVRDLGYTQGRTILCHDVFETEERMAKLMTDPVAQELVLNSGDGGKQLDLKTHCYVFSGKVVTKVDKMV
ncbi:hypothetical protein R3P38DRAFT_2808378 [Favolaschia claudopus]|uniref:Uncharacterized protein n=1 Tax=Favolaschia claudopus TaxID=2862362 RepID=A0AAV9ZH26_9AGAR